MKINSQTKIAAIIKHNIASIDAIASISKHFSKLKNPVLRRVLAPRVTIEDAARIGKCNIEEIFNKLAAIGFEIEIPKAIKEEIAISVNQELLNVINEGKIVRLDVRPSLENGIDPFNIIMEAIDALSDEFALEVINAFEPTPIIKILNKKGYLSFVDVGNDMVKTYFMKSGQEDNRKEVEIQTPSVFDVSLSEIENLKERFSHNCLEIDVRDMEMPLPMVTVLNELEKLNEHSALFVHHKKIPQYLLTELKERDFKTWITEIDSNNVKLLIHK